VSAMPRWADGGPGSWPGDRLDCSTILAVGRRDKNQRRAGGGGGGEDPGVDAWGRHPLTIRGMAKAVGLSNTTVLRSWRAFGLQPHRSDSFKLSSDPQLVETVP